MCDSTKWLAPLAMEGYWRPNSSDLEFYECEDSRCDAETSDTIFDNCRDGYSGPVCSLCLEGFAMVSDVCIPCSPSQAYTAWPRSRLYGFMFAVFFLFFILSLAVFLKPLLRSYGAALVPRVIRQSIVRHMGDSGHNGRVFTDADTAAITYGLRLVTFITVPVRLVVENLQIVSSFRKSMAIKWPGSIYTVIIKRLSVLNFNFLSLPSDACLTPRTDLFKTMHGITISVAGLSLYIVALWMIGRTVMLVRRWPTVQVRNFDRASLSYIVMVCTFSCASRPPPPLSSLD